MSVTCGYFNSIDGDRKYNAETMTRYFEGLISDGVYNAVGDKLQVTSGDDLSVNVATGRAMISCRWIHNSSVYNLTLKQADTKAQRYDAIVLRLNLNDNVRDFTIEVKTGTNALNNPTKPSIENTALVKELCLAYILVDANADRIKQSKIEDMRGSTLCPWVTGLITQVDTTTLFSQFETAYNELYQDWAKKFDDLLAQKNLEFEKWFSAIEKSLNIHLELKTYQNVVVTNSTVSELTLGIAEYETGNLLFVDANGVSLTEKLDYTVEGEGKNAIVHLLNQLETNNIVTFRLVKGYSVSYNSYVATSNLLTTSVEDNNNINSTYASNYTKEEVSYD